MSDSKTEASVSNTSKAENQKDAVAEGNAKGRRSSAGKPKISRIMKDVQEGEALLKQLGHKEEEGSSGRRTTRSSARGSVGSLPATPPPRVPAKRERRSGSTSASPTNNSAESPDKAVEKAVEKKSEPKKKASPPPKKAKVTPARRGGGRGRGRPKKSETNVEDQSEEDAEGEGDGNHVEESAKDKDVEVNDKDKDVEVNDKDKDEKMEVDEEEGAKGDKEESKEPKVNDTAKVTPESPSKKAEAESDSSAKDKLEEKQRGYLKLLDWNKRDEKREQNTRNMTLEQAALKEKLEAKELYLEEMQSSLRRRELEVEEFANKATFGLNQRVEEMKVRMNLMKEKHRNDLDLLTAKLESAQTETERLNAEVKSLQGKLVIREDQIDELNAMRSQWPDGSPLERKLVRLEEMTEALSNELTEVRRERDSYRNGAQRLAERVDKLQRQLETLRCNENEAVRAHIFLNEERKDLRKDREAAAELAKNLEELAKTYSQKDTNIQEANLLTEKIGKRTHGQASSGAQLLSNRGSRSNLSSIVNYYKKYLQPGELSKMSAEEIDAELTRLVGERDKMIGNGEVLRTDPIIQTLDQALTRMASDLMARN